MGWGDYSAQIFLFGAEFTWVYGNQFGSRRGKARAQSEGATVTPAEPANEAPVTPVSAYARSSAAGAASRMSPRANFGGPGGRAGRMPPGANLGAQGGLPVPAGPLVVESEPGPLSTERSARKRHPFG